MRQVPNLAWKVAGLACTITIGMVVVAWGVVQSQPTPTYQTNGRVIAITVSGDTVYIGGKFTSVRPAGDPPGTGEVARNHAAAISLSTGKLLAWNPNVNGTVASIAADGSTVYLGGSFTTVRGVSRRDLAAVNGTTGAALAWNPTANGEVFALRQLSGTVYAGGGFSAVNGASRKHLAAINPTSGTLTSWAPSADGTVRAMIFTGGGSRLIVGGLFTHIGSRSQNHIAALSPSTGGLLPWRDHVSYPVDDLTADSQRIYVAGGGGGGNIGGFNASTGGRVWIGGTDGDVQGDATVGGIVYLGGHFQTYCGHGPGGQNCSNGTHRLHLLAVNAATGDLTAWNPGANSILGIFAVTATSGGSVLIGGDFTSTGGRAQQGYAHYLP
jgi:hypothetical protein